MGWPAHLSTRAYGTITEGAASLLLCTYRDRGPNAPRLWYTNECMYVAAVSLRTCGGVYEECRYVCMYRVWRSDARSAPSSGATLTSTKDAESKAVQHPVHLWSYDRAGILLLLNNLDLQL